MLKRIFVGHKYILYKTLLKNKDTTGQKLPGVSCNDLDVEALFLFFPSRNPFLVHYVFPANIPIPIKFVKQNT